MKRSMIGRSLAVELSRRRDCRVGLSDVPIKIQGRPELYLIWSTEWGKDGRLKVAAYPAIRARPSGLECKGTDLCAPELGLHSASCYKIGYPPGVLKDLRPEECVLAGKWPVACCRPRGKIDKAP